MITHDPTDPRAVASGALDQWSLHGYVLTDDDGEITKDTEQVLEVIYAEVSRAVATNAADRATVAITRRTLTSVVFPNAPGAEPGTNDMDPFELAVWKHLDSYVWGRTNPDARKGAIQRMLGARNTGLVLNREKLIKEGTREPALCVYVTADWELIRLKNLGPMADADAERATAYGNQLRTVIERQPGIKDDLTRDANATIRRIGKTIKDNLALANPAEPADDDSTEDDDSSAGE